MNRCRRWLCLALVPLVSAIGMLLPAAAQDLSIPLAPPDTQVTFTTYAMSMFALPGSFTSFKGVLQVDPDHPKGCSVTVNVDVASLAMADPARIRIALGPKMLDAAAFPTLTYHGSCLGNEASGTLTMHGVSEPVTLFATREGERVTATGSLHRQDFGISGLPGLIGRTIRIGFAVTLPEAVARLVDR